MYIYHSQLMKPTPSDLESPALAINVDKITYTGQYLIRTFSEG